MNKGIDIEREKLEQSEADWKFGATSDRGIGVVPKELRLHYLPKGELQFGKEDFMDCATRGPLNKLEMILNYLRDTNQLPDPQWFEDNGYIGQNGFELSDRFISIKSGTTREGNSLKSPIDAIRKCGVIPKKLLPASSTMTFDEYQDKSKITGEMDNLGLAFLTKISVNYERVDRSQFSDFYDSVIVAGHAWDEPILNVYQKSTGSINHVWLNVYPAYTAFDNYLDQGIPDDFIKQLSPDFTFFDYGYRLIINLASKEEQLNAFQKLLIKLLQLNVIFLIRKVATGFGSVVADLFSKKLE